MPLYEKVSFKTRLQSGNRIQIPTLVRWRYKLETYQILQVSIRCMSVWQWLSFTSSLLAVEDIFQENSSSYY